MTDPPGDLALEDTSLESAELGAPRDVGGRSAVMSSATQGREDASSGDLLAGGSAKDGGPQSERPHVAKFLLVRQLGRGGMGVVYLAEDRTLQRTVALKLLRYGSADEGTRGRFLREARAAAAITHPNVAVVYEVGEAEGRIYIAMELVEGESLRARLNRGPIDARTALEVAVQIARALSAAHEKGIVHRDLKPENVMLTPKGGVKLLDFGLAKVGIQRTDTPGDSAAADALLSFQEGRVMGTPAYMSPEQAQGDTVDLRSDVFAFGIVLYEMISGHRPFEGLTANDVMLAVVEAAPLPLLGADDRTEALVTRCLAKAPSDRFADGGVVLEALTSVAPREPVVEERRRRPSLAVVSALLALSLVAAAAWKVGARASLGRGSPSVAQPASGAAALPQLVAAEPAVAERAVPLAPRTDPLPVNPSAQSDSAATTSTVVRREDKKAAVGGRTPAPKATGATGLSDQLGERSILASSAAIASASASSAPLSAPPPDPCDPPYFIDEAGRHHYKSGCLSQ